MPQKTKNKVKDMPETKPGSMPTTIRIENDILGFIRKDAKNQSQNNTPGNQLSH